MFFSFLLLVLCLEVFSTRLCIVWRIIFRLFFSDLCALIARQFFRGMILFLSQVFLSLREGVGSVLKKYRGVILLWRVQQHLRFPHHGFSAMSMGFRF